MRTNAWKVYLSLLVIVVFGCGEPEPRDVFTGPAVKAAMEAAENVAPGRMEVTAFTAHDTGHLIGIEGRSYILRLPQVTSQHPRCYFGHQWYVDGKPQGEPEYSPRWQHDLVETTGCWLVDIAVQRNYFCKNPDLEALAWARFKSLDGSRGWRRGPIKLKPPEAYQYHADHRFYLVTASGRDIQTGEDIPLAVWCVWIQPLMERELPTSRSPDLLDVARVSPAACVFFVRFQEKHPGSAR